MAKTTPKQQKKRLGGCTGKGFKPGQSGNPKGRPRTAKFSEAVQRLAAEVDPKSNLSGAETLARHAYRRAIKGSARHAELFLNYAEGKPKQGLELSGPDGGPMQFQNLSIEEIKERSRTLLSRLLGDQMSLLGREIREIVLAQVRKENGNG